MCFFSFSEQPSPCKNMNSTGGYYQQEHLCKVRIDNNYNDLFYKNRTQRNVNHFNIMSYSLRKVICVQQI